MLYIISVDANTFRMHGDDLTVKPDLYPKDYEASAIKAPNEVEPRIVIKHKNLGNEIVTIRDCSKLSIDIIGSESSVGVIYATAEAAVSAFNTMNSGAPLDGAVRTRLVDSEGNTLLPSGTPAKLEYELTRPADTPGAYSIGDAIMPATAAVKQKETVTLTGTSGTANISIVNGINRNATFNASLTQTAADFVAAYAADFLAIGVVLTSAVADLIFEASVAGVSFSAPIVTNLTLTLNGTVAHTTVNVTLLPFELPYASIRNNGGGIAFLMKLESNITAMAGCIIRVWFYNSVPTGVVGDHVAFINSYANSAKRCFYVDVTFDALLAGSDTVIGIVDISKEYITKVGGNSLYCLLQTLTSFTPTSAGKIYVGLSVVKLS